MFYYIINLNGISYDLLKEISTSNTDCGHTATVEGYFAICLGNPAPESEYIISCERGASYTLPSGDTLSVFA